MNIGDDRVAEPMLQGVRDLIEEAGDRPLLEALRLIETLDERGSLDEVVARIRPRLAVLRPIRAIGLRRLVTLPFEDVLVLGAAWAPGRGRIDRGALATLHAAILAGLPAGMVEEVRTACRGRFMNEQGLVLTLGHRLWPAAAGALQRAQAEPAGGGDRAMAEQMRNAGLLLGVAPVVVPLLWRLPPRPMPELVEEERKAALDLLRFGRAGGPELLELLLQLLLARTASPAAILELPFATELAIPPREAEPLVGRAAAACLAEMTAPPPPSGQARAMAAAAGAIERLVGWIRSLEAGGTRLGVDRATLREMRGRATRSIGSHLSEAVAGALPRQFARLRDGQPAPDSLMAEIEEAARAVRRIGIAGRDLGMAETVDRTLAQARPLFVGTAPSAEGDTGRFDRARIVEILFGPEAALASLGMTPAPRR